MPGWRDYLIPEPETAANARFRPSVPDGCGGGDRLVSNGSKAEKLSMSWLDRLKSSLGLNSTETVPAKVDPASIAYSMPTVAAPVTNKLWKCPLHVDRGCYQQMPAEWLGAAVNVYIGAETYEEALTKAVHFLRHKGMVFVDLIGGKITQLDPDLWWDGYVMANYPEHRDFFPSQHQIGAIVSQGLVFHGPFAGWDRGQ